MVYLNLSLLLSPSIAAWDSEDIDHWKTVEIQPGDMAGPLLAESSFATLFPRYREKYLQQVWPHVKRCLKELVNQNIPVMSIFHPILHLPGNRVSVGCH